MIVTTCEKHVIWESVQKREGTSKIEIFMSQNPPEEWSAFVKHAAKKAQKTAIDKCREESDLITAKKEIVRVVNGYEAGVYLLGERSRPNRGN